MKARTRALFQRAVRVFRSGGLCLVTASFACGSYISSGADGGALVVRRLGRPLPLPQGAPQGDCERQAWYDLAPAELRTREAVLPRSGSVAYVSLQHGIAAFPHGSQEVKELDDLWPRLEEPGLEQGHRARLGPVHAALWRSFYWSLAGLGGMGAGVGTAAVIGDEAPTAAAVFGLTGLGIGLVAAIGALSSLPSGSELRYAEARRWLLVRGEDDFAAAERGIDRANARRRLDCAGQPAVDEGQTAPRQGDAPPP